MEELQLCRCYFMFFCHIVQSRLVLVTFPYVCMTAVVLIRVWFIWSLKESMKRAAWSLGLIRHFVFQYPPSNQVLMGLSYCIWQVTHHQRTATWFGYQKWGIIKTSTAKWGMHDEHSSFPHLKDTHQYEEYGERWIILTFLLLLLNLHARLVGIIR